MIGMRTNVCKEGENLSACNNERMNIDIGSINGTPSKTSILLSLQSIDSSMSKEIVTLLPSMADPSESPLDDETTTLSYISLQPDFP